MVRRWKLIGQLHLHGANRSKFLIGYFAMKEDFNNHSGWHGFHLLHMGLMVLGMGFVMAATAAGANATIGDGIYQTGAMFVMAAVSTITTGIPIGIDMIGNLFEGEIMPTTTEIGSMHAGDHSGMTHDFSGAAESYHEVHDGGHYHLEHLEDDSLSEPIISEKALELLKGLD